MGWHDAAMTKLCIGLNKVALLRSSRGGNLPDLVQVAAMLCAGGCQAVLVHQWLDNRHVQPGDVFALAGMEQVRVGRLELNVGSDLRADVINLVLRAEHVHGFVVTPFDARHRTTQRGWTRVDDQQLLRAVVAQLQPRTSVSVFCDPEPEGIELAAAGGASSVELNCRRFVESLGSSRAADEVARLQAAAAFARERAMAVHAAHDLGLPELRTLTRQVQLDQVSVGHRFIAAAVLEGAIAVLPHYLWAAR
jgi:pyridoxine 5-phosphate synthase